MQRGIPHVEGSFIISARSDRDRNNCMLNTLRDYSGATVIRYFLWGDSNIQVVLLHHRGKEYS